MSEEKIKVDTGKIKKEINTKEELMKAVMTLRGRSFEVAIRPYDANHVTIGGHRREVEAFKTELTNLGLLMESVVLSSPSPITVSEEKMGIRLFF